MKDVLVACEECGEKALIAGYARSNASLAGRSLPIGWRVWTDGRSDVKVLCPNHNDDEHFEKHSGEYPDEG